MTSEKILQDLQNSLNVCDSTIDIFTENKSHGTEVQAVMIMKAQ